MGDDEITVEKITGMNSGVIKPRIAKEQEKQSQRTKSRAEVFTPSWLCNQMNNDLDEAWFGRRDVFNTEAVADDGAKTWTATAEPVAFPRSKGRGWHAYVEAPRLEITCGEAPFVCSRYDTVTGDELPVGERVGFLDRKLRVVTEKTKTRKEWARRALDALRATYGFEYQGDNLLIARINVLETFAEHLHDRWGSDPEQDELEQAAWIVSWNFWQMNGFTDAVPTNKMGAEVESTLGTYEQPAPEPIQPSLFDLFDGGFGDDQEETPEGPRETVPLCVIYDWKADEPFEFASMKGKATTMGKKFYAVIGNPPYQEQVDGDNKNSVAPIYPAFMEGSYAVGELVELIHPARFLFNAGSTPKAWNNKMLNDRHFKVLDYEADSASLFPNTDIKGGVAITMRDPSKDYGAIGIFTAYDELNSLLKKVVKRTDFSPFSQIVITRTAYRLTDKMHEDFPDALGCLSDGHPYDMSTNIFERLPQIFFTEKPDDGNDYIGILGRENNTRTTKYVRADYVNKPDNLDQWKVIVPAANGSGALGEVLSTPLIGYPLIGHTESFISIGSFETEAEAEATIKYVKSKFARCMLGVLKATQHNPPEKWAYIPLQDFTPASDIDWSKSIPEIDQQLYAKYGLDESEIEFIESHVKEMD